MTAVRLPAADPLDGGRPCHALVPCAGIGTRAGAAGPKQYVEVGGVSVVAHTLAALRQVARLRSVLVLLSPDDRQWQARWETAATDAGASAERRGPAVRTARCGGATRAETVAAGLEVLAGQGAHEDDWVLVHDAARCLVQPAWIDRLIDACLGDPVGGLLALPLADTLKHEADGRAAATIDRAGKWAAQTPQMFRLGLLRRALAQAGAAVTDEASAVEALGLAPRLVPGSLENFKLTWPEDFALAERLLRR